TSGPGSGSSTGESKTIRIAGAEGLGLGIGLPRAGLGSGIGQLAPVAESGPLGDGVFSVTYSAEPEAELAGEPRMHPQSESDSEVDEPRLHLEEDSDSGGRNQADDGDADSARSPSIVARFNWDSPEPKAGVRAEPEPESL